MGKLAGKGLTTDCSRNWVEWCRHWHQQGGRVAQGAAPSNLALSADVSQASKQHDRAPGTLDVRQCLKQLEKIGES